MTLFKEAAACYREMKDLARASGKIERTSKSYVELNFQGDTEEEKNEREPPNALFCLCQTIADCIPFN
jgi:hypothetical protein